MEINFPVLNKEFLLQNWYERSAQFWVLSKVSSKQYFFLSCANHLQCLAIEMILKGFIIYFDTTIKLEIDTKYSMEIFQKQSHNLEKIINRFNQCSPVFKIEIVTNNEFRYRKDGNKLQISVTVWKSECGHSEDIYNGRYPTIDGEVVKFDTSAMLDFLFIELCNYLKTIILIKNDPLKKLSKSEFKTLNKYIRIWANWK